MAATADLAASGRQGSGHGVPALPGLMDRHPRLALAAVFLGAFAVLQLGALLAAPRHLGVFDQRFYVATAWDLLTHGVYADGIFDRVDGTQAVPPPGMFLAPLYPLLLAGLMRLDPALLQGAECVVRHLDALDVGRHCAPYRGLVMPVHMAFLAGALACLFASARRLSGSAALAALATLLATGLLWIYLRLLQLAMTESLALLLFALALHALLRTLDGGGRRWAALAGLALGLLILTRPSYQLLMPVLLAALAGAMLLAASRAERWRRAGLALAGCLGLLLPTAPWVIRNAVELGRPAISAGYGPAVLVERLAYNDMGWGEWRRSFVFWLPDIGDDLARRLFGAAAVDRLDWNRPDSFYMVGQDRRQAMLAREGGIDDALGGLLREQVLGKAAKHAAVTLALAWCGLWIGRNALVAILVFLPFGLAAAARAGRLRPVLLWMAPPWLMLIVHAAASVNQERYNLALAFGFSLLAAWGLAALLARRFPAFRGIPGADRARRAIVDQGRE